MGSGDADAQIPHTSTETWTSSLGFRELEPYQAWMANNYVQGYVTRYEHNFTFATVKGAGHMVHCTVPLLHMRWFLASLRHSTSMKAVRVETQVSRWTLMLYK